MVRIGFALLFFSVAALAADATLDDTERTHAQKLQADFVKFRKFTGDVLDMKTGMLNNAAGFLTNVDELYASIMSSFAALVDYEKALAVALARTAAIWRHATTWSSSAAPSVPPSWPPVVHGWRPC